MPGVEGRPLYFVIVRRLPYFGHVCDCVLLDADQILQAFQGVSRLCIDCILTKSVDFGAVVVSRFFSCGAFVSCAGRTQQIKILQV